MKLIKVAIVDDHRLFTDGLKAFTENESDIEVIGTAQDGRSFFLGIQNWGVPDVLILDIRLKDEPDGGVKIAGRLRDLHPEVKIIGLSMHADGRFIDAMLKQGCLGYLLKDSSKQEFIKSIREVSKGKRFLPPKVQDIFMNYLYERKVEPRTKPKLTKREKEVLPYLLKGDPARVIAAHLGISQTTVETHRRNLIRKCKVQNTVDLVRFATANNLLDEGHSESDLLLES